MKPESIKSKWVDGSFQREWKSYNREQLNNIGLSNETYNFLQCGFMVSAAPCIDFNKYPNGEKFLNIVDFYQKFDLLLDSEKRRYIVFGSDGAGNMICIDIRDHDKIVLLDHEMDFVKIMDINQNITEFARCILIYNDFIKRALKKYNYDIWWEEKLQKSEIDQLITEFSSYKKEILKESDFWSTEINCLNSQLKNNN